VTSRLPALLAEAQPAGRAYTGECRQRANSVLALTHQEAAMILTKLGETDLCLDRLIVAWSRRRIRETRW
jgi:hypothetical protein